MKPKDVNAPICRQLMLAIPSNNTAPTFRKWREESLPSEMRNLADLKDIVFKPNDVEYEYFWDSNKTNAKFEGALNDFKNMY